MRGSLVYLIPIALILALVVILSQRNKPQSLGESIIGVTPAPIDGSSTLSPTPANTPTIMQKSEEPSSSPSSGNSQMMEWRYSNSTITSETSNSLELQSLDDPEKVTDWYKNKISSDGMSIKTFVTTNSNGNVLNKLSGASNGESVSVEINKADGSSSVTISVKL